MRLARARGPGKIPHNWTSSDVTLRVTPRLGIDLGGTKIEIVALGETDSGGRERELLRRRVATPREDYAASIESMARLVADAEKEVCRAGERCTVGIGIPGSLSPTTGLVRNGNSTWLNGRPLKAGPS